MPAPIVYMMVLVVGTAVMLSLWSALIFGEVPHETIRFVMGAYGSVICVLLFASLLLGCLGWWVEEPPPCGATPMEPTPKEPSRGYPRHG